MECNNILLDYYKEEKRRGVWRFPAAEGRARPVCWGWGRVSRRGDLGSGAPAASGRGRSAGCPEPPLWALQTFTQASASPAKLLSLIISVSLQWCFFGLFVSGHTLV